VITIVGGGTAGLVTALLIKERTNYNVRVIKSDKIGIIGVGEGSTEHWEDFMKVARINVFEMMRKTDATCKLGIYFKNWTDKPYYHNINHFNKNKIGQYPAGVAINYINDIEQIKMTDHFTIDGKIEHTKTHAPSRQFHFNTFKLNQWLIDKCISREIDVIDDEIKDVVVNENGISKLISENHTYTSEFYIDCTGFKRLLISKLGAKWQSYSKYLKLNEAIAFPTGDTDEYTPYTTATAMSSGWMWRIPVWGRHGNGYIFDNNYMNAEQAKLEAEKHLGYEVEIAKNIKFEPGTLDKPWIKNCMATGLAANFVEPLEASSIATTINQAFIFLNTYVNNSQKERNIFNDKMNDLMINIRDFIALHYVVNRNDTDFWKNMKTVELPDTLIDKLEIAKTRMIIQDDFKSPDYLLFREDNWNSVLYGTHYYDKDIIKKELEKYHKSLVSYCDGQNKEYQEKLTKLAENYYISHKKWVEKARNVA
tara:strand:- start:165 stop:1604 length:1440 start_codon:yes stop_codon:yes gene_type:complete